MSTGTFNCPICGFDKPHTHDSFALSHRDTLNEAQRREIRLRAEHDYKVSELHAEFEEDPFAYVHKYGSINSFESAYLDIWRNERDARLSQQCSALAVESVAVSAEGRLKDERIATLTAEVTRLRKELGLATCIADEMRKYVVGVEAEVERLHERIRVGHCRVGVCEEPNAVCVCPCPDCDRRNQLSDLRLKAGRLVDALLELKNQSKQPDDADMARIETQIEELRAALAGTAREPDRT